MSKLSDLNNKLEKLAKDIEQPESFEEDYQKWLLMRDEEAPSTVRERKLPLDLVEKLETKYDSDESEVSDKKNLDPTAKLRNRGTVVVPAKKTKDKSKDHYPINNIDQARNALARVHQYDKAPSWWKGSLKELQDLVSRKVHAKFPSIGKDKKSSLNNYLNIINGTNEHSVDASSSSFNVYLNKNANMDIKTMNALVELQKQFQQNIETL